MSTLTQSAVTLLSAEETHLAETSSKVLRNLVGTGEPLPPTATLRVSVEQPNGERTELALPNAALSLLRTMLSELSLGKNITVLATDAEVTTKQAADFLKVSRPYVVKLLEEGKIPFRKIGPRRRVLLQDLLHYKAQEEAERHCGLDELVAEAQQLGMY